MALDKILPSGENGETARVKINASFDGVDAMAAAWELFDGSPGKLRTTYDVVFEGGALVMGYDPSIELLYSPTSHNAGLKIVGSFDRVVSSLSYGITEKELALALYSDTSGAKESEVVLKPNGSISAPFAQSITEPKDLATKEFVDHAISEIPVAEPPPPAPPFVPDVIELPIVGTTVSLAECIAAFKMTVDPDWTLNKLFCIEDTSGPPQIFDIIYVAHDGATEQDHGRFAFEKMRYAR